MMSKLNMFVVNLKYQTNLRTLQWEPQAAFHVCLKLNNWPSTKTCPKWCVAIKDASPSVQDPCLGQTGGTILLDWVFFLHTGTKMGWTPHRTLVGEPATEGSAQSQFVINHPPVITIFMGGIPTIKNSGGLWHCYTHITQSLVCWPCQHALIGETCSDENRVITWVSQIENPIHRLTLA